MFTLKATKTEPTKLDEVIDNVLTHMSGITPETPEYATTVDQLTKLYKLKEQDAPQQVSMDTLAVVVGNLVGILMILNFERLHIVTSKAIGFVLKPR